MAIFGDFGDISIGPKHTQGAVSILINFFFPNRCREIVRLKIPYIPDPPFMGLAAVAGKPHLDIDSVGPNMVRLAQKFDVANT
jgi:hypothetical protein